jgi:hypothetical protein
MGEVIISYFTIDGVINLSQFGMRYASQHTDNPIQDYGIQLAKQLNISVNDSLNWIAYMPALMHAIVINESSICSYPMELITCVSQFCLYGREILK